MADLRDFTGKNRKFKGAAGITVSDSGLGSGDRVNEKGRLRFNDTTDLLEYYTGVEWKSIDAPPILTSINIDGAGASATGFINSSLSGNTTIVIAGSLFDPNNATVILEASSGSNITPTTTTNDSSNQITIIVPYSSFVNANEPYNIKVTNPSGLSALLEQAISVDTTPTFTNAADTTFSIFDGARSGITIAAADLCGATDAEGDTITYSVSSGALPSGLSLNTSTAVITGSVSAVGTDTTSTFSITAAQNGGAGNTTRQFKITVKAPQVTSYTSTGSFTFANPAGIATLDVLLIGGGGGGGWGGGGAGGYIYRPGFSVTPGANIPGNIGTGGPGSNGTATSGQDSVFSTLTAKGGGGGGNHGPGSGANGRPGGSGGGVGRDGGPGGTGGSAQQPGQPGESGNYGHGHPGGPNPHGMSGWQSGGGGGGAGGAGGPGSPHHPSNEGPGGPGGPGRSSDITGSSVTRAGGGGGGKHSPSGRPAGSPGPGGGGAGAIHSTGPNGGTNQGGGGGGGHPGGVGGPGVVILRY